MSFTKITTPKGAASYPSLTRPDTRYNAEGVYKTGLVLKGKDAEGLISQIKEIYVEEFGAKKLTAAAQLPYKPNDDGTTTFNFKTKTIPKLFDSKGIIIKDTTDLKVGSGSSIKVHAAAKAYNAGGKTGVTMYLNAVQIIDLVEYSGSPSGAEEGGFEAAAQEKFSDAPETEDVDF